ncbi:hypothetical protein QBC38DRAFT_538669 [Podospora fimiseda]|uniref:T6SS Phospholipase effector Tle1-like catalytic domain-containing protein n=1 Tax=Podospora fimiseda TaxID=252190 RepID=A0AAN7BJ05_9PEZI|nr:hypothetical protein QBC38DRAFT_538669 [Podospora fimiseda]
MVSNCKVCTSYNGRVNIKKRLIVCCDGTFSGVDKGTDDYASNVGRISRAISRVGLTKTGEKIPQIVYYQSGVGTGSLTYVDKSRQGAFGGSLAENVCEAYNFLASNWGPGDEIFIFGFSRGAYTARSLAGFICQVGLLTPVMMDHFFEIYQAYRNRGEKHFVETEWANTVMVAGELGSPPKDNPNYKPTRLEHLQEYSHLHVTIKVVGVWDTVGSLHITNWFGQAGDDTTYHTTKLSPKIENAFHALAIDETRGNFPPTLWYLDHSCLHEDGSPKVNLKQVWFPGYHSDVGGHSKGSIDTNSVDEITFAWMCDQVYGMLQFSMEVMMRYIFLRIGQIKWDVTGKDKKKIRDLEARWREIKWSNGTFEDNNGWLNGWWIPSLVSTAKASYYRAPGETKAFDEWDHDGVKIPIDFTRFNEEVHPSVYQRMVDTKDQGKKAYVPTPFRKGSGWVYVPPTKEERGHWKKEVDGREIVLYEYTIPRFEGTEEQINSGLQHLCYGIEQLMAPAEVLAAQEAFVEKA